MNQQNACNSKCDECLFKQLICKYISDDEFNVLRTTTIIKNFKKNEYIFEQNRQTDYLVYLTKGVVKFSYTKSKDKRSILTIIKAPSLLGLANILNEDTNAFSIETIENSEGCLIDLNNLKFIALQNNLFMMNIIKMSTDMFKNSILNFIRLAHKRVYGRIADILLYLSKEIYNSPEFILSLSRQEFAEYAGCSKENVINTLRGMDKDKIIEVHTKKIKILDFEKLEFISKIG